MRIAFHHAYFLPWLGYFSKLEHSDIFVILDYVGFRRNHIKRVQVLNGNNEPCWLCVPVGNNWSRPCNQVLLPSSHKYIDKLLRNIYLSYRHAESFDEEFPILDEKIRTALSRNQYLLDANIELISTLNPFSGTYRKKIVLASEFPFIKDRTDRIIELSSRLGAKELLIGDGKMLKVHDWEKINNSGIKVVRQSFMESHPYYKQMHTARSRNEFVKGLSIIDSILNIGSRNTFSIARSSRYAPKSLDRDAINKSLKEEA